MHQSACTWHNGRTGAETRFDVDDLTYAAPDWDSPIRIAASGSLAGTFQALPIQVAGTLGPLRDLRNATKPYPVKINGRLGQVDLAVDGTVEQPLNLAGVSLRLSLSGERLDQLASYLGVPMPVLPRFRGTSKLEGGKGHWRLNALTVALGKSDLEGGLAIDMTPRVPDVTANLTSSNIDLADFKGLAGTTPPHAAVPEKPRESAAKRDLIFSAKPIHVHKLPDIDIALSFYGTRIMSAGGLPLQTVTFDLQLQNGAITVKPLRFHTADGDFGLTLHFTPFT